MQNIDRETVLGFGDEWSRFRYNTPGTKELEAMFSSYFSIFPFEELPSAPVGADFGCGTGRWARFIAPKVSTLHCIDASEAALTVARANLKASRNCVFHCASIDSLEILNNSLDFGYSLGVLHHVPDTIAALRSCVDKLKPGAPFLIYIYYAFDNKPAWYKAVWRLSDIGRRAISRLPSSLRYALTQAIAGVVYFPIARVAAIVERTGVSVQNFPLAAYRHRSFYVMRTDALDRFGTRLEQRFTRSQIHAFMKAAGLRDIRFSNKLPFWIALGYKGESSERR